MTGVSLLVFSLGLLLLGFIYPPQYSLRAVACGGLDPVAIFHRDHRMPCQGNGLGRCLAWIADASWPSRALLYVATCARGLPVSWPMRARGGRSLGFLRHWLAGALGQPLLGPVRKGGSADPARPQLDQVADHSATTLHAADLTALLNPEGAQPQTGVGDYAQVAASRELVVGPHANRHSFWFLPIPAVSGRWPSRWERGGAHRRPGLHSTELQQAAGGWRHREVQVFIDGVDAKQRRALPNGYIPADPARFRPGAGAFCRPARKRCVPSEPFLYNPGLTAVVSLCRE